MAVYNSDTHPSPRMRFQLEFVENHYSLNPLLNPPLVLNIGCSDDPAEFGDRAWHFDMDDWTGTHRHFTQGDAHDLPFEDESFHLVVMADIHEHLVNPIQATLEAARVLAPNGFLVMTIFEEWRLPGPGQHIEYSSRINKPFPDDRVVYADNDENPHLYHINAFTDQHIWEIIGHTCVEMGLMIVRYSKVLEAVHEGHPIMNWLIALHKRRMS